MNSDDTNKAVVQDADESDVTSREIQMCTVSTDFPTDAMINLSELQINLHGSNYIVDGGQHLSNSLAYSSEMNTERSSVPFLFINRPTSFIMPPVASQTLRIASSQPASINIEPNQPQSLFLQALSKLNESSINLRVVNHLQNLYLSANQCLGKTVIDLKSPELTPPNSLTSAPPSYSFVLRQMATRRRPRLMGTFIPSPSFVQHTPPPNYAAAFDIYVENALPPPPPRVYHFGFTPVPIVCPQCGYTGLTLVTSKTTICTHLCAIVLCIFCCWICAPLPYVMRSCKDVYHYCRNCRNFLGLYCPTNPEQTYP